jgi:hypothetical protein
MITLINGKVQNASNIFVPNGSIKFQLNVDATVLASPFGFVCADIPITFQLDANGDILPNAPAAAAQIYSNAELNPQNSIGLGTYYLVTIYDQNGARLNAVPMWWQFPEAAGSTVDISQMVPFSTIGGNVIFYPTSFTIPAPSPSTLGGVYSNAGSAHQWISAINTDGSVTLTQPAFSDISGQISAGQLPSPLSFGATEFTGLITADANIKLGVAGTTSGQITMEGSTSGSCTIAAPAVSGTSTNPITISNSIQIPSGTVYAISTDTGISRASAGVLDIGNGTAGNHTGGIICATVVTSGLITAQGNIQVGLNGTAAGVVTLEGSTSGGCTITAPAVAGTATNPITISNSLKLPSGTAFSFNADTGISRSAAGVLAIGTGAAGSVAGSANAALFAGPLQSSVQVASGSTDAITFPGVTMITATGVDATTLALPTAGAFGTGQDGSWIRIISTAAHAHTVTVATAGHFIVTNAVGAKTTATFTNAADFIEAVAYGGYWYVLAYSSSGVSWT